LQADLAVEMDLQVEPADLEVIRAETPRCPQERRGEGLRDRVLDFALRIDANELQEFADAEFSSSSFIVASLVDSWIARR
jgi:hypothetical protein